MNYLTERLKRTASRKWVTRLAIAYLVFLLFLALFANWLPLGFTSGEAMGQIHLLEPFRWDMYEPGKPFHWLGTDYMGRDLLAILVYGARTAFLISLPTMALAALIGVSLGLIAGYYGDTGIKWSIGKYVALLVSVLFFLFYAFVAKISFLPGGSPGSNALKILLVGLISYLLHKALRFLFSKLPLFGHKIPLSFDFFLLKLIEILGAVPRLLLVLC